MMLRGNFGEVKLRLPRPVVKITHKVLRRGMSLFLPIGAAVAGVTVSMLEFMCTGQVYLPSLMYMRTVATTKTYATFLLFFYNIAFIIPLYAVFIVTLLGLPSRKLQKAGNYLYPTAKLALGMVFLVLGLYLLDRVARVLLAL